LGVRKSTLLFTNPTRSTSWEENGKVASRMLQKCGNNRLSV